MGKGVVDEYHDVRHGELIELSETEVSIMEVMFDDHDEDWGLHALCRTLG